MKTNWIRPLQGLLCSCILFIALNSCQKEVSLNKESVTVLSTDNNTTDSGTIAASVVILIDEESIDNGNAPNNFSETDVNDQLAKIGLRNQLRYFKNNAGKEIELYTGEVGDEAWHVLKTIPNSWINAGPTTNGTRNYLLAGPGLGGGNDGSEILLDKIPDVTPLRATGLKMLTGKTVLAVVYDGDVSINYDPLNGNLQGANLGVVALEVLEVRRRTDGSSGSLPLVKVRIISVDAALTSALKLFSNAPAPQSSSVPFDVNPPANVPAITLSNAR